MSFGCSSRSYLLGYRLISPRPLALKFGRRPVYMSSNVLMGVACVWLGLATEASYTPFVIGRAFLGLFEAPIESIVPSTITDVFFLHDRGEKVSLYGFSVLSGNELGPLVSFIPPAVVSSLTAWPTVLCPHYSTSWDELGILHRRDVHCLELRYNVPLDARN